MHLMSSTDLIVAPCVIKCVPLCARQSTPSSHRITWEIFIHFTTVYALNLSFSLLTNRPKCVWLTMEQRLNCAVTSRTMWPVTANEVSCAWCAFVSLAVSRWKRSLIALQRRIVSPLVLRDGVVAFRQWRLILFRLGGSKSSCVGALVGMRPVPVRSADGGGDIFDFIQRGNIEQCVHFLHHDRSVLKQKGNIKWNLIN